MALKNSREILHDSYITPVLKKLKHSRLKVFFLPDGNGRAKKIHRLNYDVGGNNVVKIIYGMIERGDIDKVIFGLLSKENILKRDKAFFEEMYRAFNGLGKKIVNNNEIVKAGVNLQLVGGMDLLRQRSELGSKLADMVEGVMLLTQEKVAKSVMETKFGFDYSSDILLKEEIDALIRSGMEASNSVRTSGLAVNSNMVVCGLDDLFPLLTIDNINQQLDRVKEGGYAHWEERGQSVEFLKILSQSRLSGATKITFTIRAEIWDAVKTIFEENRQYGVEFFDKFGKLVDQSGNKKSEKKLKLIDSEGLESYLNLYKPTFNSVIAPGQEGQQFVLPEKPELGYATVFGAGGLPKDIVEGIRQSIFSFQENPPLVGGSREMLVFNNPDEDLKMERPEFRRYRRMQKFFEANYVDNLEDLAKTFCKISMINDKKEQYNFMSDLFVGKMLSFAQLYEMDFKRPEQLTAFANYAHTSLFLTYYPNHPNWEELSVGWEKRAECLAEYMEIVYMLDDRIFDLNLPAELKRRELDFATAALVGAIRGEKAEVRDDYLTSDIVKSLVTAIGELRGKLKVNGEGQYFQKWQEVFVKLVDCHRQEFRKTEQEEEDKNRKIDLQEMQVKYLIPEMPDFIKTPLRKIADELPEDGVLSLVQRTDLELINYLCEIENSIGSAMVYRTLMALIPENELNLSSEQQFLYEEICVLINMYFRLANDYAELSRAADDQEEGYDAMAILSKKHPNRSEQLKVVLAGAELEILLKKAKLAIMEKREQLKVSSLNSPLWRVAIAIIRSDIGELFYKGTHYRSADRNKVEQFFDQLASSGLQ